MAYSETFVSVSHSVENLKIVCTVASVSVP
jgi:hypothetical protein